MSVSLVSYALTTDTRYRDYIGVSSFTSTQTDVVRTIINAVTDYIENYTGRRFKQTAYSNQEYNGPYEEMIVLEQFPVDSSETFTFQYRESGSNVDSWGTMDTENYHIDYDAGIIYGAGRSKFVLARYRYRVSYTAGFDFDNSSTFAGDAGIGDLELATWMLTSEIWFRRKGSPDVKSERLGDYAFTLGDGVLSGSGEGGPNASIVMSILDKYKRVEAESYLTPVNTTSSEDAVWQPEEISLTGT